MPTRIHTINAFSDSEDEDNSFSINVSYNATIEQISLSYDGDSDDISFPRCAVSVIIEAMNRLLADNS